MTEQRQDRLGALAAILLGVVGFFVFASWWVLIPTNIAWLVSGDKAMHQLGWMFYRDTPWGLPPGANPRLGIELANSIALVDGLPLFAIPFKLISPLLPRPFQYWGDWWLLCFVLQSVFAYRLARELSASRVVALFAAGFAILTPAFLFRLSLHMALAGHWTIVAGLFLYARRDPPKLWMWPLLVGVTAAVHAYLFVMVGGIWFAAYLQRLWLRPVRGRDIALEPVAVAAVIGAVLWTVGFSYTGSLGGIGYGFYRLNLLGPFIGYQSWSQVFPRVPHSDYDYEGISFLGVGIFAALALSIITGSIAKLHALFTSRWVLLLLLCVAYCVFALSNTVGLGDHETVPLPFGPLEALGAIFRSSGRFVWPMLYLVTVGAIVLAVRRLPTTFAAAALTVLFAYQIYDSAHGWQTFRREMPAPSSTWPTPLVSPFWDRAVASGITRVRGIPVSFRNPNWRWLEYYGATHNLAVDTVYLGRIDDKASKALNDREKTVLEGAPADPGTLYSLDVWSAVHMAPHVQPGDLFAQIDGLLVFIPGGAGLVGGLGIDPHSAATVRPWTPPSVWGMSAA